MGILEELLGLDWIAYQRCVCPLDSLATDALAATLLEEAQKHPQELIELGRMLACLEEELETQ